MIDKFRVGQGQSASVNTVRVDEWKRGNTGKNDCFWNIAKNQAMDTFGEGNYTNADIEKIMDEIISYNDSMTEQSVNRDTVIHTNEQIFIPLKYSIDEVSENISAKTQESTEYEGKLTTATNELTGLNTEVDNALAAYDSAAAAYSSAPKENADGEPNPALEGLKAAMDQAKAKYMEALERQQAKQKEVDALQSKLDEIKTALEQYKTDLEGLIDEFSKLEDKEKQELGDIDAKIKELDNKAKSANAKLEKAKQAEEAAKADQQVAATAGITYNEQGKAVEPKNGLTPDVIAKAAAAPAAVQNAPVDEAAAALLKDVAGADFDVANAAVKADGNSTTYTVKNDRGKDVQVTYTKGDDGVLKETKRTIQNEDNSYTQFYPGGVRYSNGVTTPMTDVKTYNLNDKGEEELISLTVYGQEYTAPENLDTSKLMSHADITKDANGQKVNVIKDYKDGAVSTVKVIYKDAEGKSVRETMTPDDYEEFVKDNPNLNIASLKGGAAAPAAAMAEGEVAVPANQDRAQFFNDIQSNNIYTSDYTVNLIKEYTELQNKVNANTATDAEKARVETIYTDLTGYKANIDKIAEYTDENITNDPILSKLVQDYGVVEQFKLEFVYKELSADKAMALAQARIQILSAQAQMFNAYNRTDAALKNMTPTQQLLSSTDVYSFETMHSNAVNNPGNISNSYGTLYELAFEGSTQEDIDRNVEYATNAFLGHAEIFNNIYDEINISAHEKNQNDTGYDTNSVVELRKAYDEFMLDAWENSGWIKPKEVKEAKAEAEKIIQYAMADGDYPGAIQIDVLIQGLINLNAKYN